MDLDVVFGYGFQVGRKCLTNERGRRDLALINFRKLDSFGSEQVGVLLVQ